MQLLATPCSGKGHHSITNLKDDQVNCKNPHHHHCHPKSSNGLNLPLVCLLSPGKCQDFNGWWWTNQIFSFCLVFTLFCQECFWQFKMIKFNSKMMEWLNLVFFFFHLYLPGEFLFKISFRRGSRWRNIISRWWND